MRVLNFIWSLPVKIIKSACSPLNLESTEATAKMPRRRPLHTCAASCVAIAHKACTKLQDLDGPLGSTTKRVIAFSNSFVPFVYTMLYQWLALLSIIDDHILTIESKIEIIFPRSTRLFDKIDGLVCSAEILPQQLEDVFRKFPSMMHQFPLLDWIVVHLISWLNFLLSILTHWGSKNTREKEITIDINCNDIHSCKTDQSEEKANATEPSKSVHLEDVEKSQENANVARNSEQENGNEAVRNCIEPTKTVPSEVIHLSVKRLHSWKSRIKALEEPLYAGDSPMYSSYQSANSSPVSDCSFDEIHPCNQTGKGDAMSCTYKEMLERGRKEDDEREEDNAHDELFPKAFVNQGEGS